MLKKDICKRCEGTGRLPSCDHVQMGRCFRCGGSGIEPLKSKAYMFEVVFNDGHPHSGLGRHKVVIERTVNTCTEADVWAYLAAQNYTPSKREGASGAFTLISIDLANVATKLTLRNKV